MSCLDLVSILCHRVTHRTHKLQDKSNTKVRATQQPNTHVAHTTLTVSHRTDRPTGVRRQSESQHTRHARAARTIASWSSSHRHPVRYKQHIQSTEYGAHNTFNQQRNLTRPRKDMSLSRLRYVPRSYCCTLSSLDSLKSSRLSFRLPRFPLPARTDIMLRLLLNPTL